MIKKPIEPSTVLPSSLYILATDWSVWSAWVEFKIGQKIARNAFVAATFHWRGSDRRMMRWFAFLLCCNIWQILYLFFELDKYRPSGCNQLCWTWIWQICCEIFKQQGSAKVVQLSKTATAWIYKNVLHLTRQNLPLKRFRTTPNALLMQEST